MALSEIELSLFEGGLLVGIPLVHVYLWWRLA
jgi:hypothetical protein